MIETIDRAGLDNILSNFPPMVSPHFNRKKPSIQKKIYSGKKLVKKYSHAMLSNVFLNCEAFQRLGFEGKINQLSHFHGNALLSIVNKFENGVERFIENMVGWGESEAQINQIFGYEKYPPCTCQKAQELGICKKSHPESCMKSVNGSSPSPIRFATRAINPQKHLDEVLEKYFGGANE